MQIKSDAKIVEFSLHITIIQIILIKNIEEYNPGKELKVLIAFVDMISNIISNKKRNPIGTELFIRDRKLNISLLFLDNLMLLYQEYYTKFYTLFCKFQTHESFNKSRLIIHQLLTIKTL